MNRGELSTSSATRPGVTLEYEVRGTGAPVLLIHVGLCAASFAPVMDQPALRGYQLVRYHRRGYAASSAAVAPVSIPDQAADAAALVGYLGLGPVHVVGHSYGELIAMQLALDCPVAVSALVGPTMTEVSGPASAVWKGRIPVIVATPSVGGGCDGTGSTSATEP